MEINVGVQKLLKKYFIVQRLKKIQKIQKKKKKKKKKIKGLNFFDAIPRLVELF